MLCLGIFKRRISVYKLLGHWWMWHLVMWMLIGLRRLWHWMRPDIVTRMGLTRHRCDVCLIRWSLTNTHGYVWVFHIIVRTIVHWVGAVITILVLLVKIMLLLRIMFWI